MKIHEKIAHCCIVDGGLGPIVMPNIIMEEIILQCSKRTLKKVLAFNNSLQEIDEIKGVTLVLCSHLEITTFFNIQVM